MNIAARNNFNLTYNQQPKILDNPLYATLSLGAKAVYSFLYEWYKHSNSVYKDYIGEYITVARQVIADGIRVSYKTVIKYIKELARYGLILDRRMGVKEFNRISFVDISDEFKYERKSTHETIVSEEVVEPSAIIEEDVIDENDPITNVKFHIFDLYEEIITTSSAKQILKVAKYDFNTINLALEYMCCKPYDNFVAKLRDTIRNRYWESKKATKEKDHKSGTPPSKKKKVNNKRFTNILSHDWDMDKLEQIEMLRNDLRVGAITPEEYEEMVDNL